VNFSRKPFFDGYRKAFGALNQEQVDGLEFLLGKIESDPEWKLVEEVAYVLATIRHETDDTYQPIKEYRAKAGTKLRKTQDRYWPSGYFGRGYVMITWEENYKKFGIADHPEKALEPETAYRILSEGMRKGTFTGKKLSDFISEKEIDYYEARTIVNGHDKALAIADLAESFETILRAAEVKEKQPPALPDLPPPPKVLPDSTSTPTATIPAIPPLPANVPAWAKKIVGWGAGLNFGGLGISFAFLRDNPNALAAVLNIAKWGLIALGGVVLLIVIGVFIKAMWNAKLANDLNMVRLKNYADRDTHDIDFSGWKAAPDKAEVKL